jgi:aminoglycoside phosphotransferase (APT) family kinase protein
MSATYRGVLPESDPLYCFLAGQVLDSVLGFKCGRPVFDVYGLDTSSSIFRYYDRRSFVSLVAKFYGNKWLHGRQTGEPELRAELMRQEFDNLRRVRALGLNSPPHRVVRPLAVSRELNCALIEEFARGSNLDFYILEARDWGKTEQLRSCITDVAWFLADLHTRSQLGEAVGGDEALDYFNKIAGELAHWHIISDEEERRLKDLGERWGQSGLLRRGKQVLIHGDVNPSNFIWSGEHDLVVVDLEALRIGDRAADAGALAAELKHLFWWYWHDRWTSESYIQHFYAEYADHLPEAVEEFDSLTTRSRFYMGCVELRIARNSWLDLAYRRQLIEDSFACLKI